MGPLLARESVVLWSQEPAVGRVAPAVASRGV